jgi:hypothetical protein
MKTVSLVIVLGLALSWGLNSSYADPVGGADARPMRFAVIGDRTGGHDPGVHGQILQEIERLKPDFIVGVGDMIEGYSGDTVSVKQEWKEYLAIIEPLSMPMYLIPANHDIWDEASEKLYRRYVGEPYYSFDVGGAHFLVLDTSRWDSASTFPAEQLEWAKQDLEKHKDAAYTIAVFHKPYWIQTIAVGEPDPIHDVFVDYGVDAVFTGHYHTYFSGEFDGILYTGIGSSGGACDPGLTGLRYHFVWVTVDEGEFSIAPIKTGAVLPWDEVTAGLFTFANRAEREAIDITKLDVGGEVFVPETKVDVTIANLDTTSLLSGSLAWEVPKAWSIYPNKLPVNIAPGATHTASFTVETDGPIYPVPVLTMEHPYTGGKSFTIKKPIPLTRSVYAYMTKRPPVIDGMLREEAWTEPTTQFFAPDGSPVTTDPVDFYFAWDEGNLYVAASCTESDIGAMVAAATEHDAAVYGEDCVGFFLQPEMPDGPVYQIYFNALGTAFDQKITVEDGEGVDADAAWNGTYEVKTFKTSDYWSIEARIPLAQFETSGSYGTTWTLNFRRKQRRLNTTADWQVPIGYNPREYGILVMQ